MQLITKEGYTVTTAAPDSDAKGNVTRVDSCLFHKALGCDEGFQYTHAIKVFLGQRRKPVSWTSSTNASGAITSS